MTLSNSLINCFSHNRTANNHHPHGVNKGTASSIHGDTKLEAKRNTVLQNLNEIIHHFSSLKGRNNTTGKQEGHYDKLLYNSMINAEKSRNPDLRIAYVEGGIKALNKVDFNKVEQVLIRSKPPEDHIITADVRDMGKQKSVVIIESLPDPDYIEYYSRDFQKDIPSNAKVSVFCMDQQRSSHGCRIFSLSNASKLSDMSHAMDKLHKYNLNNKPSEVMSIMGSKDHMLAGKVDIYDMPKDISPKLMKHINARSTLQKLEPSALTQPINKKGQTLPTRMKEHLVQRSEYGNMDGSLINKKRVYSASIEDKRMTYLERTKEYLKTAPAKEIESLTKGFQKLQESHLMPSQATQDSDSDSEDDT